MDYALLQLCPPTKKGASFEDHLKDYKWKQEVLWGWYGHPTFRAIQLGIFCMFLGRILAL